MGVWFDVQSNTLSFFKSRNALTSYVEQTLMHLSFHRRYKITNGLYTAPKNSYLRC
jgi:hypothetical protein